MPTRQCPHCGKDVFEKVRQCPYCREALPPVPRVRTVDPLRSSDGNTKIRNGLLCVLLGALVHYFAGGYSAMQLPFPIQPIVTIYLSPLLFLSGLGLLSFGLYLKQTA